MAQVDPKQAAAWFVGTLHCEAFPVWGTKPDGQCRCGDPHDGTRKHGPENIGKHPATIHGFKDATRNLESIQTFLSNPGTPSYGLIPPPDVLVIDVDGQGQARWRELEQQLGELPLTLTTVTGNGFHYWFRWPAAIGPMPRGKFHGFVVRHHDDGYLVGPGSRHATGRVYDVLRDAEGRPYPLAELPETWARSAITNGATIVPVNGVAMLPTVSSAIVIKGGYVIPEVVPTGASRYDEIVRYTAHLFYFRRTLDEMWLLVRGVLAPRFAEPLTEPELRSRFDRATRELGKSSRVGQAPEIRRPVDPESFPIPEDRGVAVLSALGEVVYIDDLIRPGRIVAWASEEGVGKTSTVAGELAIRCAVAGGLLAGTWEVLENVNVLYLSEMHPDDDYARESAVLASLELERSRLVGHYFRLPLMTAAGGPPALTVAEWRTWVTAWMRANDVRLMIVDTVTGATQVNPWGAPIQQVFADLRVMLEDYPALAIILVVHCRKPTGRMERGLSDVLGEWGRWSDVVVLHENDGQSLERAKLTVRKRVRHERRIVATKRGGLLVEPIDIAPGARKVSPADVVAAVREAPGMTYAELATKLDVSKDTATRYVKELGDQLKIVRGRTPTGVPAANRIYPIAASPQGHAQSVAAVAAVEAGPHRRTPPPLKGVVEGRVRRCTRSSHPPQRGAKRAAAPGDLTTEARRVFGDDLVDAEERGSDA